MGWIYSYRLPATLVARELIIGFHYPPPVGEVRLNVRSNGGADAFIHSEIFGHQYYRLPLASAPRTILDLGANIGLAAIYFSRMYPQAEIACVEPFPDNVRLLQANLKLNGVRGRVFPAAIDIKDGCVGVELHPQDYGHKIAKSPETASFSVPSVSVPTIMRDMRWDRIGLLKVDIEGHETVLLAEACDWLHTVDALCIEWHDGSAKAHLDRIASQFGFAPPQNVRGIWLLNRQPHSPS